MFAEKFAQTLNDFGVKGADLCRQTGVHPGVVSDFLRGVADSKISTLEKLLLGLEAIRPGSYNHFCSLLAAHPITSLGLEQLVQQLEPEDLGRLLYLIGERFCELSKDTRTRKKP